MNDDFPSAEFSPAGSEHELKEEGCQEPHFSKSFSETIAVLTRSLTASHTSVNENLNNGFNANDLVIKANEPHALNHLGVPLSTLKLSENQKYSSFF